MSLPVWLRPAFQHLLQAMKQQRVNHAPMLHGSIGIGKRLLAKAYAQRLLCRAQSDEACSVCEECLLFQAGSHPDFHAVSIVEGKQSISIEQIRELSVSLQISAHRSGFRVALIEPSEAMTIAAANALLKTLEEPGGNTVIVLVVDDLSKVPATIRSRCQRMPVAAPSSEQARQFLAADLPDLEPETAEKLLQISAGAPMLAKLRWQQGALQQVEALEQGLKAIARGQASVADVAAGQSDIELALASLQRIVIGGLQKSLQHEGPLPASLWDGFAETVQQAALAYRRNPALNGALLLTSVLVQWFDFTAFLRHSKA